jgi:hypothetical protein
MSTSPPLLGYAAHDLRVGRQHGFEPRAEVIGLSPCSATRATAVSRIASRASRRWASIVSFHSLGTSQGYSVTILETVCIDRDRVFRKTAGMNRQRKTGLLSHGWHRSTALVVAVKVVIVALVLVLPAGFALSLGAAHVVALALVAVGVVVLLIVKHRSRK